MPSASRPAAPTPKPPDSRVVGGLVRHTLVFDVGKTNKKVLVYDERLEIVHEANARMDETVDEDGYPCEDLAVLTAWMDVHLANLRARFPITHLNVSTYGASLVYVDEAGQPVTPLYNYLKPIETGFLRKLYRAHGGPQHFHAVTGSPPLGALNSGFQLAWLREYRREAFAKTRHALHLPNYLSYRLTGRAVADYGSIGCHTALWDFGRKRYHAWLHDGGEDALATRLPPAVSNDATAPGTGVAAGLTVGTGIHDSSAALLPYLRDAREPFVLLSTGTWAIAFNPDNQSPLTTYELSRDCLNFLRADGRPVKASRLFLGREHDLQCEALATHYDVDPDTYKMAVYRADHDPIGQTRHFRWVAMASPFEDAPAATAYVDADYALAYHRLVRELVDAQVEQLRLIVEDDDLRLLYVDGGFARSEVFLSALRRSYPRARVEPARHAQGTALGAALVLRSSSPPAP